MPLMAYGFMCTPQVQGADASGCVLSGCSVRCAGSFPLRSSGLGWFGVVRCRRDDLMSSPTPDTCHEVTLIIRKVFRMPAPHPPGLRRRPVELAVKATNRCFSDVSVKTDCLDEQMGEVDGKYATFTADVEKAAVAIQTRLLREDA